MGKTLKGSDAIMKKLEEIAKRMGGGAVEVGFMNNATYPDGTPVAAVAFWNEFGTSDGIPARPFFRNMIASESGTWPDTMARQAKGTGYDAERTLALMGEDIGGALRQSINDFTAPDNAESTIAAKGGASKPLIDTSHMINSIAYRVNSGAIVPIKK